MVQIVKSACGMCQTGCGILVQLDGARIQKISGDPDSPINKGRLCPKGAASLEYLNHPGRLKNPLKRQGPRGGGSWREISWDEALDTVAENLLKTKAAFGPEGLVFIRGSFKGGYEGAHLARLANVLGAPNVASMAPVCYIPRVNGNQLTYGFEPVPDYAFPPAAIMVWGANLAETRIGEHQDLMEAVDRGAELVVIDPRRTPLAERAAVWLQPRPGSDLALALSLIQTIIEEEWVDWAFVDRWCTGFEELKTHSLRFSPEALESVTWVKPDRVRAAAKLYATAKPAILQAGNAIDHSPHNVQTARALAILRALTGNLGIPGGEAPGVPPGVLPMGSPVFDLREKLPAEIRDKRLNARDGLLPNIFYALPQSIVRAVLEEDPYPVRLAYVQGCNPLLTYPHTGRVFQALQKLDFLAVADLFLTPTAALADVVLPAASYLEYDAVLAPPYYPVVQVQQKVARVGESRSDAAIIRGLAQRLGLGEFFWESEEEGLDFILEPAGLCFQEFRQIGVLSGHRSFRHYEKQGFATPSGKVEFFSSRLRDWGFDPLPVYRPLPETPDGSPELAREYPLVLTSWKVGAFRHSGGRQIDSLRQSHPEAVVWIHPETAEKLGIAEGDRAVIETARGRITQRAKLTDKIDPRVVGADYAWWFPERGVESLFDWDQANINMLTDDRNPSGSELGTPQLRGFLCRVYKPDEGSA